MIKQKPANVAEENWDEEDGKPIRDVRTFRDIPPHRAHHFFQTIRTKPATEAYRKGWERIFGEGKGK